MICIHCPCGAMSRSIECISAYSRWMTCQILDLQVESARHRSVLATWQPTVERSHRQTSPLTTTPVPYANGYWRRQWVHSAWVAYNVLWRTARGSYSMLYACVDKVNVHDIGLWWHLMYLFCDEPQERLIDVRPCQHDNSYMDGQSQTKVHTDEWTQVHSAQSSLVVTHPCTNRARRYLTSTTESSSKHVVANAEPPLWKNDMHI